MTERHLDVLRQVVEHQPIGIVKLSEETGDPQHKVRYSLRVLEGHGLIEPTKQGAVTTDAAGPFLDAYGERLDALAERVAGLKQRVELART